MKNNSMKNISLGILSGLILSACTIEQPNSKAHIPTAKLTEPDNKKVNPQYEVKLNDASITESSLSTQDHATPLKRHQPAAKISHMPTEMLAQTYTRPAHPLPIQTPLGQDKFQTINTNGINLVAEKPVSTFSVDVDTGSYSVVRKYLNRSQLPPANAVRVEEMINYFDYKYPTDSHNETPFSIHTQVTQTPWNKNTQLVQIGVQGITPEQPRNPANLVFLIDVSGSMAAPDKLPLLKKAFKLMLKKLNEQDSVSLVVYAGASGVVLNPTSGDQRATILNALESLRSGGSTNGASGINLAYQLAEQSFIKNGTNRVILATDGDFNVGTTNHDALIDLIKRKKQSGIALTTLGFGQGNYNDALMEQLADHGDGNYAYIDNLNEARKTLVEQIASTLDIIAKDVKIQIEWNPEQVAHYRLIGYENRLLKREDFNNDQVDAGEIGAGHSVTALYEISLKDSQKPLIDPLRYQPNNKPTQAKKSVQNNELAYIKLRYKKPHHASNQASLLVQKALHKPNSSAHNQDHKSHTELHFSASVAAFAQKLRGVSYLEQFQYDDILNLAKQSKGEDPHGYRGEFLQLIKLAQSLDS